MEDEHKILEAYYMQQSKRVQQVGVLVGAYAALYLCKEPQRTTSGGNSLEIRRKGQGMKKKKSLALKNIADALSRIGDASHKDAACFKKMAEDAHAKKMAEEALANEMSTAEVMNHLCQIDEVISNDDWFGRCKQLLMKPPAREMYASLKGTKEQLLIFLRYACYEK